MSKNLKAIDLNIKNSLININKNLNKPQFSNNLIKRIVIMIIIIYLTLHLSK